MYKQICLIASMSALVALAACDKQDQAKVPSKHWAGPIAQSDEAQPAGSALPPSSVAQIELPPECQNGAAITILRQDSKVALCQCTDGQNVSFWGSVPKADVPNTPRDQCLSGLYYGWQIRSEPVRQLESVVATSTTVVTSTSTTKPAAPTTAIAMPTATPATTGAPVSVPVPTVAATPVATTAKNEVKTVTQDQTSDLQIVYECHEGKAAKRSLKSGSSGLNEFQTCGGDNLVCLKDRSAQRDFNASPCLCAKGSPRQVMKNIWMCE